MDGYKSVREVALEWGMSSRNIRMMCQTGKIPYASKVGNTWVIPENTCKPTDRRETTGKYKNWRNKKGDNHE